jgi:multiple sugar transport system substrate-binding protein
MWSRILIFAAALILAPPSARAADLVVWWDEGFYPGEDDAVREIIAAFEQANGKEVELVLHPDNELPDKVVAALAAGEPPDFLFGNLVAWQQWAYEDQLVALGDALGPALDLFDADAIAAATLLNGRTGERSLYGLPMGRRSNHLHVWSSLLESAGFTLADIPKEWDAFWSFWCDQVQPAVREALSRDDIWGIGLPMSPNVDTENELEQFQLAYEAHWLDRDRRLQVDDPKIREGMIKALEAYTLIWRKGCTPPDAVNWTPPDNNKAFLAQTVVMTANETLSIPNALKRERPDDYYENTATIEWPLGPSGERFPIVGRVHSAAVFKDGAHVATAKEFVRFLVAEGWLAHYLDFSAERMLPPMQKLLDQPFWLDPSDPHRMAAVMQVSSRPMQYDYAQASGNWRHGQLRQEFTWAKAIHRVAADGVSPEQAVDEAIARIKQILAE